MVFPALLPVEQDPCRALEQRALACCRVVLVRSRGVQSRTGKPGRLCRGTVCGHQPSSRMLIFPRCVHAYIYRHDTYLN